jgi:mannosyltransferase
MTIDVKKGYIYWIVSFFVLVGILLRIPRLGFQCFVTDEDFTVNIAVMTFADIWRVVITSEFTPPLFYWGEHLIAIYFGITTTTMRYIPAVFGILCIPAMFWLGKIYKDELTGLYCAGITAVLYPFIYYSQNARAYTSVLCLFIVTLIWYIKIHNGDTSRRTLITFGVLGGLCIWLHMFSAIPIGLMILDVIYTNKQASARGYVLGSFVIILLPLIQMPFTFLQQRVNKTFPFGLKWFELLAVTPGEFFNTLFPFMGLLVISGIFLERDNKVSIKLFVIAVITIIAGCVAAPFTPMYPRYYMLIDAIFILLSAITLAWLSDTFLKSDRVKLLVLILIIGFFIFFQNSSLIHLYVEQGEYVLCRAASISPPPAL